MKAPGREDRFIVNRPEYACCSERYASRSRDPRAREDPGGPDRPVSRRLVGAVGVPFDPADAPAHRSSAVVRLAHREGKPAERAAGRTNRLGEDPARAPHLVRRQVTLDDVGAREVFTRAGGSAWNCHAYQGSLAQRDPRGPDETPVARDRQLMVPLGRVQRPLLDRDPIEPRLSLPIQNETRQNRCRMSRRRDISDA